MQNWFAYLPNAGQQPISRQLSKSQRLTNTRPWAMINLNACSFARCADLKRIELDS
jgi:hypothetical protein